MSFRLRTIFFLFALVASALASFGVWGIAAVVGALVFWTLMRLPSSDGGVFVWLAAVLNAGFLIALLLPSVGSRPPSTSARCSNNLHQLVQALHRYQSMHGALPPSYLSDDAGQPAHSWRTLLLPILDRDDVFQAVDLQKPWDHPINDRILSRPIDVYQCPIDGNTISFASYFAVVGPQTAWPNGSGRPLSEITDPTGHTIVLIEARDRNVMWAEPRDLSFDEAVELLTRPVRRGEGHALDNGFFYKPGYTRCVAFADGSVAFMHAPIRREWAIALLTAGGGESVSREALDGSLRPQLDYAKCYIVGVFVTLTLLPAVGLFQTKNQRKKCGPIQREMDAHSLVNSARP
jgi:hypothetical protein